MIAALSLVVALAFVGHGAWPRAPCLSLQREDADTPRLGTGLAPVMQWIIVPVVAFALTARVEKILAQRGPRQKRSQMSVTMPEPVMKIGIMQMPMHQACVSVPMGMWLAYSHVLGPRRQDADPAKT